MAYKTYTIIYPDNYGPEWLNRENFEALLFTKQHIGKPASKEIEIVEGKEFNQVDATR